MTASRLDFNSFTCMHTLWIWWWFVQPASSTLSHVKNYLFEVKKVFNWVIDNKEGAERCAYFWKQLWCEDFGNFWCSYSFLMWKIGFFGQFTFKNTQLAQENVFCFWASRSIEKCIFFVYKTLDGKGLRQDPLDLSFWSFSTFLHHGIEEIERHLLWKFYNKIRRKNWSNVPPKVLACIGFLYKVVHKIGRLRKFNRSREIEFNFLTAWTIFMKFGTLVQHAPGDKNLPQIF